MTKAMMMLMIKMLNTDAPTLFETQIHAKSVNRKEYNGPKTDNDDTNI